MELKRSIVLNIQKLMIVDSDCDTEATFFLKLHYRPKINNHFKYVYEHVQVVIYEVTF